MQWIVSPGESALLSDGNDGRCRGRPRAALQGPRPPHCGKKRSKPSSANKGAALHQVSHFQRTSGARADSVRVRKVVSKRAQEARASSRNFSSHGKGCCKNWPITVGANARGRMDGEGFKRRIQTTSVLKLHPGAAGVQGKGVTIEVSRGLGRLNSQMLSMLCGQGFCLCSCIPTFTAAAQWADQNCGMSKSLCMRN